VLLTSPLIQNKRCLTVREAARAQGFPDGYEFLSVRQIRKQQILDVCSDSSHFRCSLVVERALQEYRQIGNAVPVQLAYALGKALGDGLVWDKLKRVPGDPDSDISEEL
jgi:DNA (cytosine-5)-methyltransferase 1